MLAPNGSKIIVYGHEQGLRVLWRGGRPFKKGSTREEKPVSKPNGTDKDVVMIIDSEEESPKPRDENYEDNASFEAEEQEYDPSEPYEPFMQSLDLSMGVEILHLAFLRFPPELHRSSLPPLLSKMLICAVTCSDFSIRLLSIPLALPSSRNKNDSKSRTKLCNITAGRSSFGETMIIFSSGTTHQSVPRGISISMTANFPEDADDVNMDEDDGNLSGLALSRHSSRSCSGSRQQNSPSWSLLVASHSADLSGLLLIHRIPLTAEGTSISTESHLPWRTQRLESQAVSVEFNSALYPAPRHSRLVVAEQKGVVRVLDCLPHSEGARGSWLVSLYTDFETTSDPIQKRKSILGADWVLDGKSILVLLSDSKWGIWDIENGGPKSADGSKTFHNLTSFALGGWIGDSLKSKPTSRGSNIIPEKKSKLAPMTPGTRKMRQDTLFTGPVSHGDGPLRGGLSVSPLRDMSMSRPDDETILLWHGTDIVLIPSLYTHWQHKVRQSGNLFGSGAKGEPKTISNIQLGGEAINEIGLFPYNQNKKSSRHSKDQAEILITGERRILIIAPSLGEPPAPAAAPAPPLITSTDRKLLAKGELDTNGLNRMMAGMENIHGQDHESPTPRSRKASQSSKRDLLML